MRSENVFNAIGMADDKYITESAPKAESNIKRQKSWFRRPIVAAALVCLVLGTAITAYAIEARQYNAAVNYLKSLGVEAKDLSDYSHQEIKQAVKVMQAGGSNELTEKIKSSKPGNIMVPAKVTSEQIRKLAPTMTYKDVIKALGETQDIGSGFYILVYEVDSKYTLNIPFSASDSQLGVTGEKLLEALQPKTSNNSNQESAQDAKAMEATKFSESTEKIQSSKPGNIMVTTKVTSEQIRKLAPTMKYKDVIKTLGETQDIGSGFYILVYEVDNKYTLNIPFSASDSQLGVTGEKLLEALQPKK